MHHRLAPKFRCLLASFLVLLATPVAELLAVEPGTGAPRVESPRVLDPAWQIELVAAEPELVTPVACCFDASGRLLVVESHTHFPPDDYEGPQADRIYLFDDRDDDGVLDRKRLFHAGGSATMGLVSLPGGWIVVARRGEVIRIRDSDGDDVADQQEVLLELNTVATYPHNGLAGVILGPDGLLYVGQGENLGEPYELVAADGSTQVGAGEGGNIFSCRADGSDLQRVATGFWNPFGLYFDPAGRLWTVGNDPDAMPPCRLLHVVPAGDYGFQFRFGRAGTHPLQAWNGELPGTLPMAAGTGEAPCAVVGRGDQLWVTSWGDNRIERYRLTPQEASWSSETEVVVQGDTNFRPVGMTVAPDGSIYVTDWADRSYPVHGKGRLWRVSRKTDAAVLPNQLPRLTELEDKASRLRTGGEVSASERLDALNHQDPFIRQAALSGLIQTDQLLTIEWNQVVTPNQRVGLLTAWRWIELAHPERVSAEQRDQWITCGLESESTDVVLAALRWATEREDQQHLPRVRELLNWPQLSPALFSSIVASIAYLETGSAARGTRDPARERLLHAFAADSDRPVKLRALSLQMLSSEAAQPSDEELLHWLSEERDRDFSREAVRLLAARATPSALSQLAKIATDNSYLPQTRADAIAGLANDAKLAAAVLDQLAMPGQPQAVRQEATRVLQVPAVDAVARPPADDLDKWNQLVGSGGDPAAGRRVFARSVCSDCHSHSGRGAKTGPDLTALSGQISSKQLLESILRPSQEVGPLYVPWRVLTVDGRVLTGLKLDAAGVAGSLRFQNADGELFDVPLADVETQSAVEQSIMPAGLEKTMSVDELRDLVAFLMSEKR